MSRKRAASPLVDPAAKSNRFDEPWTDFSLHNVLHNPASFIRIVQIMIIAYEAHRDTPVPYHCFYGDPTSVRCRESDPAQTQTKGLTFAALRAKARTEAPDAEAAPDYNKPSSHLDLIIKHLKWVSKSPQIPTARRWLVMAFMYMSDGFKDMVRKDTYGSVGSLYFDGSAGKDVDINIMSFDHRYETYISGDTVGTEFVPASLAPEASTAEVIIYNSIVRQAPPPRGF
jgi:hypothetical protein